MHVKTYNRQLQLRFELNRRKLRRMFTNFKLFFFILFILVACQTSSEFDAFNLNNVNLTKITGEPQKEETIFDSALWTAVLGAALVAALSSASSTYNHSQMDPTKTDSEWIE